MTSARTTRNRPVLIHHDRPNDNFTMIANEVMRDKRLTPIEAAILWRLMSHTGGWHFSADTLSAEWPGLSKRGAETAIRGLRRYGYVHRIIARTGNRLGTELHLFPSAPEVCGLGGCQDCDLAEPLPAQPCDPTKVTGQDDQPKHPVSAGRSDRALSDGHRVRGHIEEHVVEEHKEEHPGVSLSTEPDRRAAPAVTATAALPPHARAVAARLRAAGLSAGEREIHLLVKELKNLAKRSFTAYLHAIPAADLAVMLDEARQAGARAADREQTKAIMRAIAAVPPCDHGMPGGNLPWPTTGIPRCALCRAGVPAEVEHELTPAEIEAAKAQREETERRFADIRGRAAGERRAG